MEIFILEDDADFLHLLKKRLSSHFEVAHYHCHNSLESAKEFLESDHGIQFDLVVLDHHLPDGRGTELLEARYFDGRAVLAMSSDENPNLPGASVGAGACFFLRKIDVRSELFMPLVQGIRERNELLKELQVSSIRAAQMETVKTLVKTLQHEINNPLGAVLGAAYLVKSAPEVDPKIREAGRLVEESGLRISQVLKQLGEAVELETVKKSRQEVFHVPGDKKWETGSGE